MHMPIYNKYALIKHVVEYMGPFYLPMSTDEVTRASVIEGPIVPKIEELIPSLLQKCELQIDQEKKEDNIGKLFKYRSKENKKAVVEYGQENNGDLDGGYLSQFPNELVMIILRYLQGWDRVNLGSTCRRFRDLLLHSGIIWKSHCITLGYGQSKDAVMLPMIENITIFVDQPNAMENFCQYLFSKSNSYTKVINVIESKMRRFQDLHCWIKVSENVFKKYCIEYHPIKRSGCKL